MTPPINRVRCETFTPAGFSELVKDRSSGGGACGQVEYLGRYLTSLKAVSMLIEDHYVDRNFIEEHATYYSRCLLQRPSHCTRVHFFKETLDEPTLDAHLARAASGHEGRACVEETLNSAYLGFMIVRPIPSVPVGRTILAFRKDDGDRQFGVVSSYRVHMLGIELQVEGVAFQQQDRAVAACATTALWTALHRACRNEGMRVPSTSQITHEAGRATGSSGRLMPSPGLTVDQMCGAIRQFDFAPDFIVEEDGGTRLRLLINIYLRSGMPVVLCLTNAKGEGHAVTAVGYRRPGGVAPGYPIPGYGSIPVVNLAPGRIYIHDDRLGPYAHADLIEKSKLFSSKELHLNIAFPHGMDTWRVFGALTPLYPKIRTNADELLSRIGPFFPILQGIIGKNLSIEAFFCRSGEYLHSLFEQPFAPTQAPTFLKTFAPSRYLGVIRAFDQGAPRIDILWETTDRMREETDLEHCLGLVSLHPGVASGVAALGQALVRPVWV